MHPVVNEVEVSIEEVERYLLKWAKPGFTGQRKVFVRVLPEAGSKVIFLPAGNQIDRPDSKTSLSPEGIFDRSSGQPTERELMVSVQLAQNKYRFRIGMKLTAVLAHFVDGKLKGFEWETVGE